MDYYKKEPDFDSYKRYVGWFHELDAWTEYWDIYHPESKGKYYFGDEKTEQGLLTLFLPRLHRPSIFDAWVNMALYEKKSEFINQALAPKVASAIIEVDLLLNRLFIKYFGDASDPKVQVDYLNAIFLFAINSLPPAKERDALIPESDPRKSTAGRHTLEGDIMWFAWALQIEAANAIAKVDEQHARRNLLLSGIAIGCPANFAWKGHRRTRSEYDATLKTKKLLMKQGIKWANDFEASRKEIHTLYRIREWGCED